MPVGVGMVVGMLLPLSLTRKSAETQLVVETR